MTDDLTAAEAYDLAKDEVCRDCKMVRACSASGDFSACEGFRQVVERIMREGE